MRVRIDPELCAGHGRCYSLAPDVFDSDDIGHGRVRDEEVRPELQLSAELGIRNCPENAIAAT